MSMWNPGDIVRVSQKTGEYIAEVVEEGDAKVLVKVLAVTKFPAQGDLHTSFEVDVPLFHQRPALSYREKFYAFSNAVMRYNGPIPDYKESVRVAMEREMEKMRKMSKWAERCLVELEALHKETFTNTK